MEASDNYVTFHEVKKKTTARTLAQEAEKLLPETFIRAASRLLNFSKVEKMDASQLTIKGTSIPVSGTYRNALPGRIK